jgi:hypothetical protein
MPSQELPELPQPLPAGSRQTFKLQTPGVTHPVRQAAGGDGIQGTVMSHWYNQAAGCCGVTVNPTGLEFRHAIPHGAVQNSETTQPQQMASAAW